MAINIKNPGTEKKLRELAALTGLGITGALDKAVEESLEKTHRRRNGKKRGLAEELMEIGRRCAALPILDTRSEDEILGYDEHGIPTQ